MKSEFKGAENFLKDYKGFLVRKEWIDSIIKTYFDKYSLEEYWSDEEKGFYIKARYKKVAYRIYYRKEITLENQREVIRYRFITCLSEGEVIKMTLSIS